MNVSWTRSLRPLAELSIVSCIVDGATSNMRWPCNHISAHNHSESKLYIKKNTILRIHYVCWQRGDTSCFLVIHPPPNMWLRALTGTKGGSGQNPCNFTRAWRTLKIFCCCWLVMQWTPLIKPFDDYFKKCCKTPLSLASAMDGWKYTYVYSWKFQHSWPQYCTTAWYTIDLRIAISVKCTRHNCGTWPT